MKYLHLSLMFLFAATAQAGSFTGNGADRKGPGHGAAWFLGNRAIRWCGNHDAIAPALENAARKWSTYIEMKKIGEALRAPLPFALRFEKQSSCTGVDLEIELSADEQANVLSGSELMEQDLVNGWGRGRIWLNEKLLTKRGALETQLLHQLGHILGNDHVGGTVMAETVADVAEAIPVISTVDKNRELYFCRSCDASWTGTNGKIYREQKNTALVAGLALRFTADLAVANHSDAKLFTVALGNWQAHLASQSLARLGLLELNGRAEQVIVRRNFDKLLEIHLLNAGRTDFFFEATGE